jgi:hypothetical protein
MKNNYLSGNVFRAATIIFFSVILNGCDSDRNKPGWDYFPDMFYSTAYESFTKNPNFEDGMTMRQPVPGTVPRDFTTFNYTIDPDSRIRAGMEMVNPVSPTEEALIQGKKAYSTFCLGCHGASGAGNGSLYTSGLYPLEPRNLTDSVSKNLRDGEIFHSITLGFGSMGAHGSQIRTEERWKIVVYIRKLQEEAKRTSVIKK